MDWTKPLNGMDGAVEKRSCVTTDRCRHIVLSRDRIDDREEWHHYYDDAS